LQFIAEIALLRANIVPCLGNGICILLDVGARVRVKITFLRILAGDNMFAKRKPFDLRVLILAAMDIRASSTSCSSASGEHCVVDTLFC
jgi:hypothetical protein